MINIRKSEQRGYVDHGWLKSYHTFSFANYFDPKHMHFGNLRVINEDYIAGSKGFGSHPHFDMEIITYVISGALAHEDSMGNASTILPGEIQTMSAGTGVFHSEFNKKTNEQTHLLQIWILPKIKGIKPNYGQKSFVDKTGLSLVVSGSGRDGSIIVNQDVEIFLGKFLEEKKFEFLVKKGRKIWLQLIKGKVIINGQSLESGDAAAISSEEQIEILAMKGAEFLLFDL